MEKTKVCSKCKIEKTIKMFYKCKNHPDGLQYYCKECSSEKGKQYSENYQEKIKELRKSYREKNKDKISERNKQYYAENRDRELERVKNYQEENREEFLKRRRELYRENLEINLIKNRQYYQKNKDKINMRAKIYRAKNKKDTPAIAKERKKMTKEEVTQSRKEYRFKNKEKFKMYEEARRARKKNLTHTLTFKQWEQIKQDFGYKCAYCGTSEEEHLKKYNEHLNQEHFIALSNGGEYTHNNIIPACRSCNNSKNNKDFFEWYPQQECYSKKREKKILEYLNYTEDGKQQLSLVIGI